MKTNLVMPWEFDQNLIDEITMLRQMRIDHYEKLHSDLADTQKRLEANGVQSNQFELRKEIEDKIAELKSRLSDAKCIYADEIELYLSLI